MRSIENRNEAADRLIDVLLEEELGGVSPPDLTEQILARWAEQASAPASLGRSSAPNRSVGTSLRNARATTKRPQWISGLVVAASLLALAAGAIFWMNRPPQGNPSSELALEEPAKKSNHEPISNDQIAQVKPVTPSVNPVAPAADVEKKKAESIVSQNPKHQEPNANRATVEKPSRERLPTNALPIDPSQATPSQLAEAGGNGKEPKLAGAGNASSKPRRLSDAEILSRIDREFVSLWKSAGFIGKEGTKELSSNPIDKSEWRSRLVSLVPTEGQSETSVSDHEPLPWIRQNASAWSSRWLSMLLSSDAMARMDATAREGLIDRTSAVFAGREGWDTLMRALLTVEVPQATEKPSPESYLFVALQSPRGIELVDRLGPAILDEELVCARCHDHPLKGTVSQRDYWGLAAIFQTEVQWHSAQNGAYITTAVQGQGVPAKLFFETLDGRSRLALPMIPSRLVAAKEVSNEDLVASRVAVVDGSIATGALARSTVNQLWELAFGRPLVGSVADPDAPPEDAHLEAVRSLLADQLVAHDYDLGTALSWIVRSQPFIKPLPGDVRVTVAAAADRDLADRRQRWFFEYSARPTIESPNVLLAFAKRWNTPVGQRPDGAVLAQTTENSASRATDRASESRREERLRHAFPVRRAEVPALWLRSLPSYEEKAKHLLYVSGISRPSDRHLQWAAELRTAATDEATALHQLWWLLQHRS